jgi:hypothetical protein
LVTHIGLRSWHRADISHAARVFGTGKQGYAAREQAAHSYT